MLEIKVCCEGMQGVIENKIVNISERSVWIPVFKGFDRDNKVMCFDVKITHCHWCGKEIEFEKEKIYKTFYQGVSPLNKNSMHNNIYFKSSHWSESRKEIQDTYPDYAIIERQFEVEV